MKANIDVNRIFFTFILLGMLIVGVLMIVDTIWRGF